jgi:hypothetical protein
MKPVAWMLVDKEWNDACRYFSFPMENAIPLYTAPRELSDEEKMNILEEAQSIIYGDREKTYGHPAKNLLNIAKLWSIYLDKEVTAQDVATMMVLLKIARLKNQPDHRDSLVDSVGYLALIERIKE